MALTNKEALVDLVAGHKICKEALLDAERIYYEMRDDFLIYKIEYYNNQWFNTPLEGPQRIFWNPDSKWRLYTGIVESKEVRNDGRA